MKWAMALVLLCLLVTGPPALRADSDEDLLEKLRRVEELMRRLKDAEAEEAEEGLETFFEEEGKTVLRVHNVADLTVRLTNFTHPNLYLKPAGAEIDEDAPLFGKAEEGEMFFSGVDELMDLIVSNIWPEIWDDQDNAIYVSGPHAMLVVAPPEVQGDIHEYLQGLRRSLGRIVTVKVRVLALDSGALGSVLPGGRSALLTKEEGMKLLARAEAGQGLRIAHSVRLAGFNGQRVMLYRGAQRSFVQDYDVEVAQESKISDPIIGVLQTGFTFDVRSTLRGEEQVILDLRSQLAHVKEPVREFETRSGPVHEPDLTLADISTTVTVPVDGFALVGAGDATGHPWALLLSAAVERIEAAGGGR
ncbi:MAG: hypothetical protein ACYS99_08470 [Planctomycetota bacterium]|jgi:hypothetical protein